MRKYVWIVLAMVCTFCGSFISGCGPLDQSGTVERIRAHQAVMRGEARPEVSQPEEPIPFHRHEVNAALGFGDNQADRDMHKIVDDFNNRYGMERDWECGYSFGDSYVTANLEYHYRLNKKWEVGALMGWGASRENYNNLASYETDAPHSFFEDGDSYYGWEHCRTFVATPSVRYTWIERRGFRYYSRVALGWMHHHLAYDLSHYYVEKGKSSFVDEYKYNRIKHNLAYQLTVLGINMGGSHFRIMGELGYGCLGIVRVGLMVCF